MTSLQRSEIMLMLAMVLPLAGLFIATLRDPYINRKDRNLLLLNILLVLSLVAENWVQYDLAEYTPRIGLRTAVAVYGYIIRPVIIAVFLRILKRSGDLQLAWGLVGANALLYLTTPFTKLAFWIMSSNSFQRGPLGYSCHLISGILLLWLVIVAVKEYSRMRKYESLIPILAAVTIVAAVVTDYFAAVSSRFDYLTISAVSGTISFYIWLHLRFVREHEQDLLSEQRIQIMMSQIQPHFLYNTLSTIQALCRIDPERAFDVLGKFGTYLRQNIDSLDQPRRIPFLKELHHTQVYAEIEMVRFPSIRVEYFIEDSDFTLPALTVQPLVENAIRHGVRGLKDGRVAVTTRRLPEAHEIEILDNGRGFEMENAEPTDRTHIGLRNVRERVEQMCGGTMTIESRVGAGTRITIHIPA